VSHDGRLVIARWGCRREESRVLPCTGWTKADRIESGYRREAGAEEGVVPAAKGVDNGCWYALPAPVRVVLARGEPRDMRGERQSDGEGQLHAYVICEPASDFYRRMTHSEWMPALGGGVEPSGALGVSY
jgi:hypothetical protein